MNKRQRIVSVSGLIGAGKDTVGNYLIQEHGFTRMSFSAAIKDCVALIFGWDRDMLDGLTPESRIWRETPDPWWTDRLDLGVSVTPRWALINFATETMRNHFHQDIWPLSLERKIKNWDGDVVLTDTRHFNELALVRSMGGTLIGVYRKIPDWLGPFYKGVDQRVERGGGGTIDLQLPRTQLWLQAVGHQVVDGLGLKDRVHESEWMHTIWNDYDHVIPNTKSIDELHFRIDKALGL